MIRLGIMGVESTHTDSFLKSAQKRTDIQVTAISAETPDLLATFKQKHPDFSGVYVEPCELADYSDVIAVTVRDGAQHLKFVRAAARRAVPMWIDKPFATSVADAEAMIDLFSQLDIPYCGGTSIKHTAAVQGMKSFYEQNRDSFMSAILSFRIHINSPYSGIHFYSPHLIESALTAFGTEVKSVYSRLVGENLTVTLGYESFNVILNYAVEKMPYTYSAFAKEQNYTSFLDNQMMRDAAEEELSDIVALLGNKQREGLKEFFITAVKVSTAIIDSVNQRKEIFL